METFSFNRDKLIILLTDFIEKLNKIEEKAKKKDIEILDCWFAYKDAEI